MVAVMEWNIQGAVDLRDNTADLVVDEMMVQAVAVLLA